MPKPIEVLPDDEHNRRLVERVHPADWINPTPSGRYNLVAIGGGSAGLVSSIGSAGLGARSALVERHLLGGDCLNEGCVPSKALLRAARVAAAARDGHRFGIDATLQVDFAAVMERLRRVRTHISAHDAATRVRDMGVDLFLGHAKFTSHRTLEVDGRTLEFSRAVIATGGRPLIPPVPGLAEIAPRTSATIFELTELPRRLLVIGGGPIGCELAQAFARLGSSVTLIERDPRVLGKEEPEAADRVAERLTGDGVDVRTNASVIAGRQAGADKMLKVESNGTTVELAGDEVLVAVGRSPNTSGLDLEAAGVHHDRHGVTVDDFLRTTNRRIYAAGDVCSRYQFTHAADAMARAVIQNALFFPRARQSALVIPRATYTSPEVGAVGHTAASAGEHGIDIDTYTINFDHVDRALLDADDRGFATVHTKRGSDEIVGATMVGAHAGELIGEMTLAMTAGLGLSALAKTIHPYPTSSQAWRALGDQYNKTRLTPTTAALFRQLFAWRR